MPKSKNPEAVHYPNQHEEWPSKEHFEPYITEGPFKGSPRCQSWAKGRSGQCGNAAVKGCKTCAQAHSGGKGGRQITKGTRSKYIPKLDKEIARHLEDPELTSLRKEIAALRFRQDEVLANLRTCEEKKVDAKAHWSEWDDLAEKAKGLTIAENKRQAQLASNINARQANVLRAIILATVLDVVKDESIPRSQIPKVVGLKLIQKMS